MLLFFVSVVYEEQWNSKGVKVTIIRKWKLGVMMDGKTSFRKHLVSIMKADCFCRLMKTLP